MAKILIAGIGGGKKENGKYRETNYFIGDKIYENRSFITSALEDNFGIDKTIYIGTTGSMWDNLYEHYCKKYGIESNEEYAMYLMETIDKSNKDLRIEEMDLSYFNEQFKGKVEGRVTNFGMNESEIFENFNIIMNLQDVLSDGDEVYIDITHSFRSNAIWMFLVLNFILDVMEKNIEIKMISYGMLEIQGKEKLTPIIDLGAFYKLLKWIKGAHSLKNYGNSYSLLESNLIGDEYISKKLKSFSDAMNLNSIGTLKANLNSLKNQMSKIENIEGPGKLLIPKIVKDFINYFDGIEEEYLIQARLAKWHFSQKRYSMAYINVNESVVKFVEAELFPEAMTCSETKEREYREKCKKWLSKAYSKIENSKNLRGNKENLKLLKTYCTIFKYGSEIRNNIAHALDKGDNSTRNIETLRGYCEKIEDLLSAKGFIYEREQFLEILKEL